MAYLNINMFVGSNGLDSAKYAVLCSCQVMLYPKVCLQFLLVLLRWFIFDPHLFSLREPTLDSDFEFSVKEKKNWSNPLLLNTDVTCSMVCQLCLYALEAEFNL